MKISSARLFVLLCGLTLLSPMGCSQSPTPTTDAPTSAAAKAAAAKPLPPGAEKATGAGADWVRQHMPR